MAIRKYKQPKEAIKPKIKQDDEVIIISGKDKGRRGKVLVIDKQRHRVKVEGLNMVKKHTRPNPQLNQQGGIVEQEAFIHISNVAILNTLTQKADRIGYKTLEDGSKIRVYKSDGENIDAS